MAETGDQKGTTPPRDGLPPGGQYDQMQVMSFLMEIQKDLSALTTKVDRLIGDNREQSAKLDSISEKVTWIRAASVGAFAVAVVFLTTIWYLVGDDVKALLDYARVLPRP